MCVCVCVCIYARVCALVPFVRPAFCVFGRRIGRYVVSNIPESVQLGGTNRFYRKDLQETLHREALRVRMELRLHECDREL